MFRYIELTLGYEGEYIESYGHRRRLFLDYIGFGTEGYKKKVMNIRASG